MTLTAHLNLAIRALMGSPATWAGALLLSGLWLTHFAFSPFGITLSDRPHDPATKELAFLAALGGATVTMVETRQLELLMKRASWSMRFSGRLMIPATGAVVAAFTLLLLPSIAGQAPSLTLCVGIPACALHLAVISALLSFLPATRTVRSVSLPAIAWLLPGLLGDSVVGSFVAGLMDASRHLDLGSRDYSVLAGGIAPILGMVCALIAIDPPLRAPHEVRHPR